MLDLDRELSVSVLQLYLTPKEAMDIRNELDKLLSDPEANKHFHVFAEDMSRELSCSIVTARKLAKPGYTDLERKIFNEK
jgi:hypothetical protein